MLSLRTTRIVSLILRVLNVSAFLSSLVILSLNTVTVWRVAAGRREQHPLMFYHVVGFRYIFAANLIGIIYSIGQVVFTIKQTAQGNEGNVKFDFYAEEVMLNFIASGAVAGFIGAAEKDKDFDFPHRPVEVEHYFSMMYTASALVLFAYVCSFVLSVFSAYGLRRHDDYDY